MKSFLSEESMYSQHGNENNLNFPQFVPFNYNGDTIKNHLKLSPQNFNNPQIMLGDLLADTPSNYKSHHISLTPKNKVTFLNQ
jgi:hypothetical protein